MLRTGTGHCDMLPPDFWGHLTQVYFFDVHDGTKKFEDHSGISLKGIQEVSAEAESLLRLRAYEHPVEDANPIVLKAAERIRPEGIPSDARGRTRGHRLYRVVPEANP